MTDTRTNEEIHEDVTNWYKEQTAKEEKIIAEFVEAYKVEDAKKAESIYLKHEDLGMRMEQAIKKEGLQ